MLRIALKNLVSKWKDTLTVTHIRKLPKGPESEGGRVVGVVITAWAVASVQWQMLNKILPIYLRTHSVF